MPVDEALLPTAADFQGMRDAIKAIAPDPAHFEEFAAKNAKMVHEFPGWSDELRELPRGLFGCAAVIACGILRERPSAGHGRDGGGLPDHRLVFGPLALAFYCRWGRAASDVAARAPTAMDMPGMRPADGGTGTDHEPGRPGPESKPWWVMMATEVSHCGSGCVLGDVISEFTVFALALTFGIALPVLRAGADARPRPQGRPEGSGQSGFISLTFFEIGLFGWMAVMAVMAFSSRHRTR